MPEFERPELARLQASPPHIFAAAYVDLPHPHFAGPRQELVFTLGITAVRGNMVLLGLAVNLLADHQILSEQAWTAPMLQAHTGLPSLEIEEGTGLAIQHLYFNAPAYVRADSVLVTAVLTSANGETWNETLRIPVTFPQQSTDLRFPLRGNWWVIQGNDWRDLHKAEPVSQAFALDFVKLGSDNRFFGNTGANLEDHYGFGEPVYAPASARVAFTIWDMPDMAPGQVPDPAMMQGDARRVLGNAVALSHRRGEFSYLAHLQQGSVQVRVGDHIRRGTLLGYVGNSGHSPGPHLHYHLMNGPNLYTDQALPVQFGHVRALGVEHRQPITLTSGMIVSDIEPEQQPPELG
ncbi:MAG: M23 family metallopeptidase [Caldilineaceae bacterium SB0662_bin_9]|uniref:M23 family metallopeptidase n=1 Tax=Caldilineaceae bacterium SB0662_bin_9 TaxID=2605258 RepID=A0A6B1DTV9_9CHLR|nr:M23 family metallopeptidase [Caldilineaceae bacterium]MYD91250.1 M23 family metallopeptidase [Caldilineaceae bacterium SB0662_bin_9]